MTTLRSTLRSAIVILALALGYGAPSFAQTLTPQEARAIAKEAYIYGFPMVDSYRVQHAYFVDRGGPEFKAPWNNIANVDRVFTPADRQIQTPNTDTPSSFLGADLRGGPLVLTMPEISGDRYYVAQFVDMYTHNFAYVGTRTTGNHAGKYLLVGPDWKGPKPKGIRQVIHCETAFAFVFYRTLLRGPGDMPNVRHVQAGYKVQTLAQFLGKRARPAPAAVRFVAPLSVTEERTSPTFFDVLNFVLQFAPVDPSERALRARFAQIGIVPGGRFDIARLSPALQQAVHDGMADAWRDYQTLPGNLTSVDFFGTRAYLRGNYLYRMAGAVRGIYGNSKDEALYLGYLTDSSGLRLDGSKGRYALRFAADALPPVNAFWSLTMYDLPARMLVANPIGRYGIKSSMLPSLVHDADGGITIYVQHGSPGSKLEANWLPTPDGPFLIALRAYWPKPDLLDGRWRQPPLRRVE